MIDHHYDEMRVPPDPTLAEALRQRLHARMSVASRDDHHQGRSHLHHGAARVEPLPHLVPTEEITVTVDSPTSESRNPRRIAMAAAAVVAVAGIAFVIARSDDDKDLSPAAPPTVAPTTVAPTTVAPRTETGSFSAVAVVPAFTSIVPDGWGVFGGWLVNTDRAGVAFMKVTNIYADPCQWVLVDPPVGPTVDDLISAWANVPGFNATAAVDVTVDGYVGKQIEFTVPDYKEDECKQNKFGLWQDDGSPATRTGSQPNFWAQGPNQHNQLWILDVDGTRVVIDAFSFPDTSPQDRVALDEVLASIQIG